MDAITGILIIAHKILIKLLIFVSYCLFYYAFLIPVAAVPATHQEYKIWKSTPTPLNFCSIIKVYVFNVLWFVFSYIGSLLLLPIWASRGFADGGIEKEAHLVVEKLVAKGLLSSFLGPVEVRGEEHLPPIQIEGVDFNGTKESLPVAPVFIANHCSSIDSAAVYVPLRRFKWIAKQSIKIIPGPGTIMSMSRHIFIQRKGGKGKQGKDKKSSVLNLYEQANTAIQAGIPMMIFPQGTRRMSQKLPFKDGAFNIAMHNESVIVPISINIPPGIWNTWYPLNLLWSGSRANGNECSNKIIVTIHEGIPTKKDMDKEELKKRTQDIIYSCLPPLYHGTTGKIKEEPKKSK